jgi:hypothetical protein
LSHAFSVFDHVQPLLDATVIADMVKQLACPGNQRLKDNIMCTLLSLLCALSHTKDQGVLAAHLRMHKGPIVHYLVAVASAPQTGPSLAFYMQAVIAVSELVAPVADPPTVAPQAPLPAPGASLSNTVYVRDASTSITARMVCPSVQRVSATAPGLATALFHAQHQAAPLDGFSYAVWEDAIVALSSAAHDYSSIVQAYDDRALAEAISMAHTFHIQAHWAACVSELYKRIYHRQYAELTAIIDLPGAQTRLRVWKDLLAYTLREPQTLEPQSQSSIALMDRLLNWMFHCPLSPTPQQRA